MVHNAEQLVSEALIKLLFDLTPSREYTDTRKGAINQIIEILKQQSNYSIDRDSAHGSHDPKTEIIDSEFDVVVFLDGLYPPFKRVLMDFENILRDLDHIRGLVTTKTSLHFNYRGFDINLHPATNQHHQTRPSYNRKHHQTRPSYNRKHHQTRPSYNRNQTNHPPARSGVLFTSTQASSSATPALDHYPHRVPNPPRNPPGSRVAWQAFQTYKQIQLNPKTAQMHSSSLWETQVYFMCSQDPLIHSLIRLCKFWGKSLLISSCIGGRITLINHFAVYAGQLEIKRRRASNEEPSLVNAFLTFLELMERLSQLQIEFEFDPLEPIKFKVGNWNPRRSDVPTKTPPYVIEPANPYNNLSCRFSRPQILEFQNYALTTLKRLKQTLNQSRMYVPNLSRLLFCLQPTLIPFADDCEKKAIQELHIVAEVTAVGMDNILEFDPIGFSMEILDERHYGKMRGTLRHMSNIFGVVAHSFASSYKISQAETAGEHEILEELRGALEKRMSDCIVQHVSEKMTVSKEEMDPTDDVVTFKITLRRQEGLLLLSIHLQEVDEFENVEQELSATESDSD